MICGSRAVVRAQAEEAREQVAPCWSRRCRCRRAARRARAACSRGRGSSPSARAGASIPAWSMSGLVKITGRLVAQLAPRGAGGVAVVDPRQHLLQPRRLRAPREKLWNWSWQSALVGKSSSARASGFAREHLEQREQVAQRLARGGAGHDQHVAARAHRVERLRLVAVELPDAPRRPAPPAPDQTAGSRAPRSAPAARAPRADTRSAPRTAARSGVRRGRR